MTAPRDKLESLFLQIVEDAQQQRLVTGGALAGGEMAEFLRGDAPVDGEQVIEELISAGHQEEEPESEPTQPVPEPAKADDQVIEELIGLARAVREAIRRGEESGMAEDEVAFYDALADNASAREVMQDDTLKLIARELADRIKAKASLDWTQRETVRADMRRTVRRLLTKYGYPDERTRRKEKLDADDYIKRN